MPFKSEFFNIVAERGFYNQCTDEAGFDAYLAQCEKTGTPAVAYYGSDPTGDSLHIGHIVPIMILRWFQKLGHKPVMLVGGATARIGDPSGKDKLRPFMSEETIARNIRGLKTSYMKFLRFDDSANGAVIVDNYDWFKDIGYLEFLRDVGTYYSVNRMLTMESVKTRLEREQQMSFLEFNYQLLQGYDFCELYQKYGCRAQIAGSDQWGNITSGTELGRRRHNVDLFGFTAPLITDASGKKMGKSEGNAVWINDDKLSAFDYYQYFRNVADADVGKCLRAFTELPMNEVRRLESLKDSEINDAKKILAFEATKICRGESEAQKAADTARKTFEEKTAAENLPTITINAAQLAAGFAVVDAFVALKLTASKGETRRLMAQNGAKINDAVVGESKTVFEKSDVRNGVIKLSAGKKKHAMVKIDG